MISAELAAVEQFVERIRQHPSVIVASRINGTWKKREYISLEDLEHELDKLRDTSHTPPLNERG